MYTPDRDKYGKNTGEGPYKYTPTNRNQCKNYDIHELLKEEISGQGRSDDIPYRVHIAQTGTSNEGVVSRDLSPQVRSQKDLYTKKNISTLIPKQVAPYIPGSTDRNNIGISDTYIYCDSFNKKISSEPENGLLIYSVQDLNNQVPIKNFIEVEIYLPFFIQEPIVDDSYQPNFFFFRHIQIYFESIGGRQFVNGGSSNIFHFDLELDSAGGNIYKAHGGLSKYIFKYPVTDIQELRIRFKTPLKNIEFQQDVYTITVVPSAGPPPFNQRITTGIPHNLTIGSQVSIFFKNFNSTNSVLNKTMNSTIGHLADVIDSTTLELPNSPGSDGLGTAIDVNSNPASATMYIGDRRIAFVLRFRELREDITNYIAPI